MSSAARPYVSAALIVRDEAAVLGRCLSSVAAWVDEMVVVDTGSVDDTVEIARSFGAEVTSFPWTGDFAEARNRSLDLATGEWILYIDADEWVHPVERDVALAELRRLRECAVLKVWQRHRPGFSPYREHRLWPHRPDVRFVGRIHETMVPDLKRLRAEEGLPFVESDVFRFEHDGYEGDQTAKHLRNQPLLEQRLTELPHRVYLWNHLGQVRKALGDADGGLDAFQRGVDVIRRFGLVDRTDALAYGGLGLELIDRGIDVTDLLDEVELVCPWYLTGIWMRAANHRRQGRHAEAIAPLRRLLELGPEPTDAGVSFNTAMFTDWAWDALGDSLLQLGDRAGAAEVYATASAARPERLDLRTKSRALAASLRHQQARADQVGQGTVDQPG